MTKSLVCVASLALAAGTALAVDPMGAEMIPALPGGNGTVGYGVNDNGMVVGQADQGDSIVAFVYFMGVTEALPLLAGGSEGLAQSVNNSGVVVGTCRDAGGVSRAVKWTKAGDVWSIIDLGTLRTDDTGFGVAQRVNSAGMVIGYSTRPEGGAYHATLWDAAGNATDLGTMNYSGNLAYSQGLGLNDAGDTSGYAYRVLGGPEHGMYVPAGEHSQDITPLAQFGLAQWHQVNGNGMLGGYVSGPLTSGEFRPATWTEATSFVLAPMIEGLDGGYGYDLNNGGVLVGTMFHLEEDPTQSIFKAFVFDNGETADLNTVATGINGTMFEARSVSNSGLIVGTADSGIGFTQAVLLYPMPVACAADIGSQGGVPGSDGLLDNNDFVVFIDYFFAQDHRADVGVQGGAPGHDNEWNNNDFVVFIDQFFAGCI